MLPMGGANIVLGIQWLGTLGPVTKNHRKLTMEFQSGDCTVRLQGESQLAEAEISNSSLRRLLAKEDVAYFCHLLSDCPVPEPTPSRPKLVLLLERYAYVLAEPRGLPPERTKDHRISLIQGAEPVNVCPYRYPHYLKSKIEKLTSEMLDQGVIQWSINPFSSPVQLVKKKDGSWRFYVDYWSLNAITVCDRFPIPTMDELMDELHGAVVFTKLDLCSSYHQIQVASEDRMKTTFRTHLGHFEFSVLPFRLSNAPTTFQSTMNQFFQPLLRKYVIVFFD